jgi:parallel beta-helix repeat protein
MAFLRVLLHAVALQGTAVASAGHSGEYMYLHTGGGLTSTVMDSIISKLPPVKPPLHSGLRDGNRLMHTVRLSGAYQADVPLILPSYTRLILDGSMEALPYKLGWTPGSAGAPNQTASMVSVKDGKMVSVEGGTWSCARWNSSAAQGNTSDVAAIFFDSTSFSFIRNLQIRACGGYSGGNNSASIGVARAGYVSGNIRIAGGQSNVVEGVDSGYSSNRGIWAQTQKLVVSGGSYHHNDADGIDLDSSSSHNVIHNASFFMNARCGVFLEFSASYNTIVGNRLWSNLEACA